MKRIEFLFAVTLAAAVSLASPVWALDTNAIKFHGYIDLEYKQTTADIFDGSGPDDPNMKNGSFDQHHFNLLMDVIVSPKLIVKGHFEFEHGINPSAPNANIVLEYAFGEYVVGDLLRLRGGKMLTPWGIYNEIHDATPAYLTVSPPQAFYRADDKGGYSMMPKWITGLAVLGEAPVFTSHSDIEYIFYMGNGESREIVNQAQHDDNPNKAIGGRVQVTAHDDTWQAGVSGYYGDVAVTQGKMEETHWTLSVHLDANWGDINVHGEYGQSTFASRKEAAWYVQVSYRSGRFTPYVRHETLNPDDNIHNDRWSTSLIGVNLKLADAFSLKIEWNEHDRQSANRDIITGEEMDYGEFRSALSILF